MLVRIVIAVLLLLAWSGDAAAQSTCSDSYVAGQKLRAEGKLLEAREAFSRCLADTCAEYQRTDCGTWLDEIQEQLPTVVFHVVDADGRERADVTVTVDGRELTTELDGLPIAVDPGKQTFVLTWPGGPQVTREVTIVSGEKNRKIEVAVEPPPAPTPTPTPRPKPPVDNPLFHPAAWVLGAVGIAGIGLFAGLGGYSLSLEDCAPTCTDEEVDDIETMRLAADISLAVGGAALAAGVVVAIVTLDGQSEDEVTVSARVTGSGASLHVRF